METRHFLDIKNLTLQEFTNILSLAHDVKQNPKHYAHDAMDKKIACIFEKPSTRTRLSFETGIVELGAYPLVLSGGEMQFGFGETIADTARILSRMVDMVMIRTYGADKLKELALNATIPVINGLTDTSHPCQIMADLQTVKEEFGSIEGLKYCWIGDYNNVTQSWCEAAMVANLSLHLAIPKTYQPHNILTHSTITWHDNINDAIHNADVVITDTWVSMNHLDRTQRLIDFATYQINKDLMALAHHKAIFLHCLPAHRGEEVTNDVIDGPQSRVWDEAENRLHAQKAIMMSLLGTIS